MLRELKGRRVEIVFGPLDGVDGEVVEAQDGWLKLRRKRTTILVRTESVRRIQYRDA